MNLLPHDSDRWGNLTGGEGLAVVEGPDGVVPPFGAVGEELSVIMSTNNIGSLAFTLQGIPAGWTAEIVSIYFQDFFVHAREIA